MSLGVVCLVLAGLGCHEEQPGADPGRVLNQLSAREDAYHASVGALPTANAIRCETAIYAGDMHELLDAMRQACRESMHDGSMMRGYRLDDVTRMMDGMQSCIDAYASRLKNLEIRDHMLDACDEHHAAMSELFKDMDDMLEGISSCCGGV